MTSDSDLPMAAQGEAAAQSTCACALSVEIFGAIQCLDVMERHALAWHGLIDELQAKPRPTEQLRSPLPQWATDLVAQHAEQSWGQYTGMFLLLRTYLRAIAGLAPDCVYEIWTPAGVRLDGQFMFAEHAVAALEEQRKRWPDAFIAQMNVGVAIVDSVPTDELLPSLLGDIRYLGAQPAKNSVGRVHILCDHTGRAISVTAEALVRSDVFSRLSDFARAAVLSEPH